MIELTLKNVAELKMRCGNNPLAYALLCAIEEDKGWYNPRVEVYGYTKERKIAFIKSLRKGLGLGLKDAKHVADQWGDDHPSGVGYLTPHYIPSLDAQSAYNLRAALKEDGFVKDPLVILSEAEL